MLGTPIELLIMAVIAAAGVLFGGAANRFAQASWGADLTKRLGVASGLTILAALVLALWPMFGRHGFRAAFFLVLGGGLLGLFALGARSVSTNVRNPLILRVGLYGIGALAITAGCLTLAFVFMWGDLHFDMRQTM